MHRDIYNAQPDPGLKVISCVCGYSVANDRAGRDILKWHQSQCRKFRGLPPEEPPKEE